MRVSVRTVLTAVALLCIPLTASVAQTAQGRLRGRIVDSSGGVLPGVSVVATTGEGKLLATGVTDGAGDYLFATLPAAPVTLTFQLEGFETSAVTVVVAAGVESVVPEQRLGLATITATVDVVAKAPVDLLPVPVAPLPPPPPVVVPVPEHDHESVCGPAKADAAPVSFGTIHSPRYGAARNLYAQGDEVIIEGGTQSGLEVGRNFVVRRAYRVDRTGGASAVGEHTAGVVQIVSTDDRFSLGIVIYACDELMTGDDLAAFAPEPVRPPEPAGTPAYDAAARILFADAGQMLGVPRRLMVIDRGSDHGIHAGQRLTLFHREDRRSSPSVIGDAIVVAVRASSATIRVERAMDVIAFGDWAAPQHPRPEARSARSVVLGE